MQEMSDTVFVQGLGEDVTESDLSAHFGAIGVIKVQNTLHENEILLFCSFATECCRA